MTTDTYYLDGVRQQKTAKGMLTIVMLFTDNTLANGLSDQIFVKSIKISMITPITLHILGKERCLGLPLCVRDCFDYSSVILAL